MFSCVVRYPTFTDAVRDIDDALCMIFLFATLPSNPRIPPSLISNCARLAAEWQLYVMRSQSLRKVFLSIKGVYYQAEVMDQTVTWLVPYMFTQTVRPVPLPRICLLNVMLDPDGCGCPSHAHFPRVVSDSAGICLLQTLH